MAGLFERLKITSWRNLASEFEQQTGVTGVARAYQMPPGYNMQSLGKQINEWRCRLDREGQYGLTEVLTLFSAVAQGRFRRVHEMHSSMRGILDTLVELNPELSKLKYNPDSIMNCYDAIAGITSGFNVDDINLYINQWPDMSGAEKSQHFEIQSARIRSVLGGNCPKNIGWALSDQTMAYIEQSAQTNG